GGVTAQLTHHAPGIALADGGAVVASSAITEVIGALPLRDALPFAVDGSRRLSLEKARPHVNWLYSLASLAPPKFVVVCDSPLGADRKSTRLNSSHVKISYAVFCLKKKQSTCEWNSNANP